MLGALLGHGPFFNGKGPPTHGLMVAWYIHLSGREEVNDSLIFGILINVQLGNEASCYTFKKGKQ